MAVRIDVGPYALEWTMGRELYERQRLDATLVDEIGPVGIAEQVVTLVIRKAPFDWPVLLVAVGHTPWYDGHQINMGVLVVPETHIVFVGALDEVMAFDLHRATRLWRAEAEYGFWNWQRHGSYVLMSAETDLAAWDLQGIKQWETFVEPPYDYKVADGTVHLTVMDVPVSFSLADGPAWGKSLPWSS